MDLFKKYKVFILSLSIISAAVGAVLGALAEFLYRIENPTGHGWLSGLVLGFLIGVIYCLLTAKRKEQGKHVIGYGTLLGILAGLVCSTMVHIILMITYRTTRLSGMKIGILFGITAGAILGLISSAILEKSYPLADKTNPLAEGESSK